MNDFDILLFSETWVSSKTTLNLDLNGYFSEHIYGIKSPGTVRGRHSGGLSLYAKNYLKNKIEVVEKNSNGLLWIKLSSDLFNFKNDVFICFVYIPPSDSKILKSSDFNFGTKWKRALSHIQTKGKYSLLEI